MFSVRIRVVGFLGDEEKYPCHFPHKIGDEVIYDGEKYTGRLCVSAHTLIAQKVAILYAAGPRYVEPSCYYPFWYAPVSVKDPSLKKYDGIGFRNVLETYQEHKYHMANLAPPGAFIWPPAEKMRITNDVSVICPDVRTSVLFKLDAFDISDQGYSIPYFRRSMVILNKVLAKQGIAVDKILNEFTTEEIEGIYPALSPVMVQSLVDELQLVGHVEIRDGKVTATDKGRQKLDDFVTNLPAEDREALAL